MFVVRSAFCFLMAVMLIGCQQNRTNMQHAGRNQFYQDVKTAKVIVRESYGAPAGISLPFKNYVDAWLRIAGVTVADDDPGSADFTISITATGEPLKAKYGRRVLFTGARLIGTIQIERPSVHHKEEVRFSARSSPPRELPKEDATDYSRPENTPFMHALRLGDASSPEGPDRAVFDEFADRLASLVGRYFGKSVLLIALDEDLLHASAVEALAALGRPEVPYLIGTFLYCSPACEAGVGEALEKITGEKYGSDAKLWNEWLSRQELKR